MGRGEQVDRRRALVLGVGTVATLGVAGCSSDDEPAAASTTIPSGTATDPTTSTAPVDPAAQLRDLATARWSSELGDPALAAQLTAALFDPIFTWKGEELPVDQIDTIVAYGFGNRLDADGNPSPGPMNEQLAQLVADVLSTRPVRTFAQWEIADSLASMGVQGDITSITPVVGEDGATTYLSTAGVAAKVVELSGGDAASLGNVGIIAWYDHEVRCIETSRSAGMQAYAPAGVELPRDYDPQSGQEWTRTREAYVLQDLKARMGNVTSL